MTSIEDEAKIQQHYYDFCEMLWYNFKCCDLPATTQTLGTQSTSTDVLTVEIYDKGVSTASTQLKLADLLKWKKKHPTSSSSAPSIPPPPSSSSSQGGVSLFSIRTSDVVDFISNSSTAKKMFKGRSAPGFTNYNIYILKKSTPENAKLHSKRFKKYLRSSTDSKRPCFGQKDSYSCIPVEPGVPFWLYTYTLEDTIVFVDKQSKSDTDSGGDTTFDKEFVTLKLILAEECCAKTLRVPGKLPAGVLCRAMNEGEWGPHHHAVERKHLKYYGLFYLSIKQGWVPLEPDMQLAKCGLQKHAIVAFKRKNVCELCYQCAVGPAANLFESMKCVGKCAADNDGDDDDKGETKAKSVKKSKGGDGGDDDEDDSDEDDENANNEGEEDDDDEDDDDEGGGCKGTKSNINLKLLISLDSSIKDTEDLLDRWVSDTFGVSLVDAEKKKIMDKKKKKENRKKRKAKLLVGPIDEGFETHGSDSENDNNDDVTEEKDKKKKKKKRKCSVSEDLNIAPPQLFYKGVPAKGRIMEELRLFPGDVIELRKEDTALQFTVKYTPKSGIRHKHLAKTGFMPRASTAAIVVSSAGVAGSTSAAIAAAQPTIQRSGSLSYPPGWELGIGGGGGEHVLEFDGEKIVAPEIPDVSLIVPTPASAALELENILAAYQPAAAAAAQQDSFKTILGSVFVSNYQTYFQSKCTESSPGHVIKIPHGLIQRIEKNSKDSGDSSVTLDDTQKILTIVCKDPQIFNFIMNVNARRNLYDILCNCCGCGCPNVFAFAYRSPFEQNGWDVYNPEAEYRRIGVTTDTTATTGWRITSVNKKFAVCTTYPEVLVVPAAADDACVTKEASCRSRGRLPVLCWRDVATGASITRCSQPCVGLTGKVSESDQRYLELIRQTNIGNNSTLHILDSRPKANALANRARGGGYEDTNGSAYQGCILDFENIPNIHVVREGYEMMREIGQPGFDENEWYSRIAESKWLDMARIILLSVRKGVALLNGAHASLIIHCSDGWDRTAQCCTLTEICLDPYYRTIRGLEVLIEKDWVSFGHKFQQRYSPGELKPSDQRSPIFPQFVFCLYQLLVQFPAAFEFTETLLITILDELYACRFGTFLFNTDKERVAHKVRERTTSLWSYVNSNLNLFINKEYAPETMPIVLYPDPSHRKLRLWESYFFDWMPSLK